MKRNIRTVFIVVLLLVGGGVFLFDGILEGILKNRLEELIQNQKDRIYDYEFDEMKLKFIKGDLVLDGLRITPRSEIIDSINASGGYKREIYAVDLKEFRLKGLKSWRLLFENEIEIERIEFVDPKVIHYSNKDVNRGPGKEIVADILAPSLSYASVGEFYLQNGSFKVFHIIAGDTLPAMQFDSAVFAVQGIVIDSFKLRSGEIMEYEDASFSVMNIKVTSNEDYRFEIKSVRNDLVPDEIEFNKLRLSPRLNQYEFMESQTHQTEWFDVQVEKLTLNELDLPHFQKTGELNLSSIEIQNGDLELYLDKRLPPAPYKVKKLPSAFIRELDQIVRMDSIFVQNASIKYMEWEANANQPIEVRFDALNASLRNLTTDRFMLEKDDRLLISVETTFMSKGKMKVDFVFPVLDSTDVFTAQGSIRDLPLYSLNPIMHHAAFVKFKEGKLNLLEFFMKANNDRSRGWVNLDYSGLKKLEFMRNKSEMDEQKRKRGRSRERKQFFSFLASTLIPENYNRESRNYRQGNISFNRMKEKAIFGYLVRSIQSGVVTCVLPGKNSGDKKLKKNKQR